MDELEKAFNKTYNEFEKNNIFMNPSDDPWWYILSEGEPSYSYTLLKNEKDAREIYNKRVARGIPTIIKRVPLR